MYMCRSLLIFINFNFKMAARQPCWIFWFPDSNFSLALNITSKLQRHNTHVYGSEPIDFQWPHFLNGCLVAILDFSVSEWHGFSSVTQVCFGISVSTFMCMSLVAVGRSLTIVSYVAFKMAALWFWTMFNCNPPIAHCHPLLWGGGILVDHWSTISSLIMISLKFVPKGLINNNPVLVQIMAWRQIRTNADPINWRIYVALGGD